MRAAFLFIILSAIYKNEVSKCPISRNGNIFVNCQSGKLNNKQQWQKKKLIKKKSKLKKLR
jgi:hypothetical protein